MPVADPVISGDQVRHDEFGLFTRLSIFNHSTQYQTRSVSHERKNTNIDTLKSEPSDLVIMDINMPGTNGLQVMRKIKKLDEDIEIIVLTGSANIDNAVQALRHNGAFDFLTKPLETLDELITTVKQALQKRK
ncbi:MAG: response regulator [Deltaproteobacteria bacterium]|nr:response regulator [Deltaproteobacteria bacterium]